MTVVVSFYICWYTSPHSETRLKLLYGMLLIQRSGRVDEEIAMLHHKLKLIEDGITFVGRTTKQARSQGKKIQITAEQEISRFFFNIRSLFSFFILTLWTLHLLLDFEFFCTLAGYWVIWPGLTCKKKTIKLLKNITGEPLRCNENGVYFLSFSL